MNALASSFSIAVRMLAAACTTAPRLVALASLAFTTFVSAQPAAIERGRYLVETIGICAHCHSPQKLEGIRQVGLPGLHLAGGYGFEGPVLGRWVGPNITPDAQTGIGDWTEAQIAVAIREGRRPNGSVIGPPMPVAHYRKMSDADVAAIAAYLKSVPAVRNVVERSAYKITLPASWGPPVSGVNAPAAGDPVARGAYLAEIGHCMDCHTPNRPGGGGRDWSKIGVGGRPMQNLAGPVVAANITPDLERGLGRWTDEQVVRAITEGISANGRKLMPPMPYDHYVGMTVRDLADLVAYLRSLPAQR